MLLYSCPLPCHHSSCDGSMGMLIADCLGPPLMSCRFGARLAGYSNLDASNRGKLHSRSTCLVCASQHDCVPKRKHSACCSLPMQVHCTSAKSHDAPQLYLAPCPLMVSHYCCCHAHSTPSSFWHLRGPQSMTHIVVHILWSYTSWSMTHVMAPSAFAERR